jgi:hypothetical protein
MISLLLAAQLIAAERHVIVSAAKQPKRAVELQHRRVTKDIAVYEIVACGVGTVDPKEVRQAFLTKNLVLLSPSLGTAIGEQERARGFGAVWSILPDLAPVLTLALSAANAPQSSLLASSAASAIVAGVRAGRDPKPLSLQKDVMVLTPSQRCDSYPALGYWRGVHYAVVELR